GHGSGEHRRSSGVDDRVIARGQAGEVMGRDDAAIIVEPGEDGGGVHVTSYVIARGTRTVATAGGAAAGCYCPPPHGASMTLPGPPTHLLRTCSVAPPLHRTSTIDPFERGRTRP